MGGPRRSVVFAGVAGLVIGAGVASTSVMLAQAHPARDSAPGRAPQATSTTLPASVRRIEAVLRDLPPPTTTTTTTTLSLSAIEEILRNLPPGPATAPGTSAPTSPGSGSTTPAAPTTPGSTAPTTVVTSPTSTSPTSTPTVPSSPTSGSGGDMAGVQTYVVGQTGTLWDPDNEIPLATITVSAPQFATSDSSGDRSQYGYFATFRVTVTDIAPRSSGDTIDPSDSDYYAQVGGADYGFGQTDAGNTAAAEGPNYLGVNVGSNGLSPGQSTTGTVTIDVPSKHGALVYAPDSTDLGVWLY